MAREEVEHGVAAGGWFFESDFRAGAFPNKMNESFLCEEEEEERIFSRLLFLLLLFFFFFFFVFFLFFFVDKNDTNKLKTILKKCTRCTKKKPTRLDDNRDTTQSLSIKIEIQYCRVLKSDDPQNLAKSRRTKRVNYSTCFLIYCIIDQN